MISTDICIGCGLCITRCNYGAINLNNEFKAEITVNNSDNYRWDRKFDKSEYEERNKIYSKLDHKIPLVMLSDRYLDSFYENLFRNVKSKNGFDNLFVRNLLINLGLNTKVRSIVNNDIRFDLLAPYKGNIVLGEVGLYGLDILEGPRAILDDIAVLCSRYKFKR